MLVSTETVVSKIEEVHEALKDNATNEDIKKLFLELKHQMEWYPESGREHLVKNKFNLFSRKLSYWVEILYYNSSLGGFPPDSIIWVCNDHEENYDEIYEYVHTLVSYCGWSIKKLPVNVLLRLYAVLEYNYNKRSLERVRNLTTGQIASVVRGENFLRPIREYKHMKCIEIIQL